MSTDTADAVGEGSLRVMGSWLYENANGLLRTGEDNGSGELYVMGEPNTRTPEFEETTFVGWYGQPVWFTKVFEHLQEQRAELATLENQEQRAQERRNEAVRSKDTFLNAIRDEALQREWFSDYAQLRNEDDAVLPLNRQFRITVVCSSEDEDGLDEVINDFTQRLEGFNYELRTWEEVTQ